MCLIAADCEFFIVLARFDFNDFCIITVAGCNLDENAVAFTVTEERASDRRVLADESVYRILTQAGDKLNAAGRPGALVDVFHMIKKTDAASRCVRTDDHGVAQKVFEIPDAALIAVALVFCLFVFGIFGKVSVFARALDFGVQFGGKYIATVVQFLFDLANIDLCHFIFHIKNLAFDFNSIPHFLCENKSRILTF